MHKGYMGSHFHATNLMTSSSISTDVWEAPVLDDRPTVFFTTTISLTHDELSSMIDEYLDACRRCDAAGDAIRELDISKCISGLEPDDTERRAAAHAILQDPELIDTPYRLMTQYLDPAVFDDYWPLHRDMLCFYIFQHGMDILATGEASSKEGHWLRLNREKEIYERARLTTEATRNSAGDYSIVIHLSFGSYDGSLGYCPIQTDEEREEFERDLDAYDRRCDDLEGGDEADGEEPEGPSPFASMTENEVMRLFVGFSLPVQERPFPVPSCIGRKYPPEFLLPFQ